VFADVDPSTIQPEQMQEFHTAIAKISVSEAHRTIKVWRALWKKMATLGYCDEQNDPSMLFANTAAEPRQAV
jgi:hypothetical protein